MNIKFSNKKIIFANIALAMVLTSISFGCGTSPTAGLSKSVDQNGGVVPPEDTRRFKKVMTVIFENIDYSEALKQKFFAEFAKSGALLSNFHAETHPSQGNYVALVSGDINGVNDDSNHDVDVLHIADLLEAKGYTWKVYAEGYPGGCFLGASKGKYVRKHVPFLSFVNIQKNLSRCAHIVDGAQLEKDIQAGTLPDYSLYIPDLDNDGHDTGATFADQWFEKAFRPRLGNPTFMKDMLLVATFDESSLFGGNQIFTALYGPSVQSGSESKIKVDHYSLMKLIEDTYALGDLGKKDKTAAKIEGIWRTP